MAGFAGVSADLTRLAVINPAALSEGVSTCIDTNSNQAVVLGASMAGLLAARVLSERFERVVVIERDVLPPVGEHRRGVPHGRHLHGLHPRGREILDELFPGFTASLTASGAVRGDVLGNVRWQLSGHQLRQAHDRPAGPVRQPAVP